ncbi:MAG TPA: flavodoxin domain-containing protein [Thermotogota bacterium]|nr:flavodoxin domain-containing protein [Thermotogota bacterium]
MKILIIYDSFFGNTEKIAKQLHEVLLTEGATEIKQVDAFTNDDLKGVDLMVLGSPTRAFSPSPKMKTFIQNIPTARGTSQRFAAFDTRMNVNDVNNRFLTFLSKQFGYAVEKMAKKMLKKGYEQAGKGEGFFVKDSEGPLKEGELERAVEWVKRCL